MKKLFCVAVILCLAFTTGCKTMSGVDKSTTEGAAGGALAGGIAAKAAGGDSKQIAAAAAGGAVIGAMMTYNLAKKLEAEKKVLKGKENDLDARITYAQGVNSVTQAYNEKLTKNIQDIKKSVDNNKAKKDEVNKVQMQVREDVDLVRAELSDMKKYQKTIDTTKSPKTKTADLDAQIKKLEGSLTDLESNTQKLANLKKRIKV